MRGQGSSVNAECYLGKGEDCDWPDNIKVTVGRKK